MREYPPEYYRPQTRTLTTLLPLLLVLVSLGEQVKLTIVCDLGTRQEQTREVQVTLAAESE